MEQVAANTAFKIIDKAQFEELFNKHYSNLVAYGNNFLKDIEASEEVVQEVLFKLWTNRETLEITSSINSYLFRAVRNSCLNVIKHVNIREDYKEHNERVIQMEEGSYEDEVIVSELEEKIRESIDQLPIERRKIFIMSRYDGLKYREIAEKLGISVKTVENQMGSALKFLRIELREYMPWLILFFSHFFKNNIS
ncbi:MAG: RNA polymerase sigma-70 factor [Salinivirgaceae bacterium]|nr:RNA polymerase sigma-70 factor [Salinivirgaceae bacterium]